MIYRVATEMGKELELQLFSLAEFDRMKFQAEKFGEITSQVDYEDKCLLREQRCAIGLLPAGSNMQEELKKWKDNLFKVHVKSLN